MSTFNDSKRESRFWLESSPSLSVSDFNSKIPLLRQEDTFLKILCQDSAAIFLAISSSHHDSRISISITCWMLPSPISRPLFPYHYPTTSTTEPLTLHSTASRTSGTGSHHIKLHSNSHSKFKPIILVLTIAIFISISIDPLLISLSFPHS